MNEFAAYPQAVPGGYRVMMRFAKDGKPKPLLTGGERSHIFSTREDALEACTKHLLAYMNGNYRRDGERMERYASADALFKPVFRKGRKIEVERRRAAV